MVSHWVCRSTGVLGFSATLRGRFWAMWIPSWSARAHVHDRSFILYSCARRGTDLVLLSGGQRALSRRWRAARISASATLSSSSAYSCVVSVLACPRRRRTVSMDTPEFQFGGVGVSEALLHLAKPRHARPLILGWSDSQGQLVEGGRHPQGHRLVNAELVVAATDVLDERVPGDDDPG